MNKTSINLIALNQCDIYKQLELEEALLRADRGNFCIINFGSKDSIVLGISSLPEEMIHLDQVQDKPIQIIKRFSGGGTVYVDPKTLFITFIFNKETHLSRPYPEPILKWGETFYKNVFDHKDFHLNENDFVFGEKKIGGNALYIRKDRWLLHTSFLWDYEIDKINLLKQPTKKPKYRNNRSHENFMTRLNAFYPSPQALIKKIKKRLEVFFEIKKTWEEIPNQYLKKEHRKSLSLLRK